MAKPVSMARLYVLQNKLTEQFIRRLDEDEEEDLYTDAATVSAMIKLLKDNSVTADPLANDSLAELQSGLEDQVARLRAERAAKKAAQLAQAEQDLKAQQG